MDNVLLHSKNLKANRLYSVIQQKDGEKRMAQEVEYWMAELSNRSKGTKEKYAYIMKMFCEWLSKSPEQIIEERKNDLKAEDPREQRRYESYLKAFVNYLREEKEYSTASCQVAWASVKSFFEVNYYPLQMRRNDYPKGDSLGHRGFAKEELRRLVKDTKMSLRSKVIVFMLKDSGLRVGDLVRLKYGNIADQLEAGEKFISIKIVTQKAKIVAKTFVGEETVEVLKAYFDRRRKGTRRVAPETVTKDSPLIRHTETFSTTSRSGISSLVNSYIAKIGLSKELSAHSLRKYTQTQLESAGVHSNWVQQILGHKLSNSEGSYSRPTDEMLRNAYIKAYDALRVFPRLLTTEDISSLQDENQNLKKEIENLKQSQSVDRDALFKEVLARMKKELKLS
jgi:site-specific recombinase XerD